MEAKRSASHSQIPDLFGSLFRSDPVLPRNAPFKSRKKLNLLKKIKHEN